MRHAPADTGLAGVSLLTKDVLIRNDTPASRIRLDGKLQATALRKLGFRWSGLEEEEQWAMSCLADGWPYSHTNAPEELLYLLMRLPRDEARIATAIYLPEYAKAVNVDRFQETVKRMDEIYRTTWHHKAPLFLKEIAKPFLPEPVVAVATAPKTLLSRPPWPGTGTYAQRRQDLWIPRRRP